MLGTVTMLLAALLAAVDGRALLGDDYKVSLKSLRCDKVEYGYKIGRNHEVYKTKAYGAHQCLHKCKRRHSCHAFEYIDVKKECRLYEIRDLSKVHATLDVHSPRNAVGVPCKGEIKEVYGGSGNNNGNNSGSYNGNTNGNGGSTNSGNYNGNNSGSNNGNVNGNNGSYDSGNGNGNYSGYENGNYNGNNYSAHSGNNNGNNSGAFNGNWNGNESFNSGNNNGNGSGEYNGNNNGNNSVDSGNNNGNNSGSNNGNNNGNNDGYVDIYALRG